MGRRFQSGISLGAVRVYDGAFAKQVVGSKRMGAASKLLLRCRSLLCNDPAETKRQESSIRSVGVGTRPIIITPPMSASLIGRFGSKLDLLAGFENVRFHPESGHHSRTAICRLRAKSGRSARNAGPDAGRAVGKILHTGSGGSRPFLCRSISLVPSKAQLVNKRAVHPPYGPSSERISSASLMSSEP